MQCGNPYSEVARSAHARAQALSGARRSCHFLQDGRTECMTFQVSCLFETMECSSDDYEFHMQTYLLRDDKYTPPPKRIVDDAKIDHVVAANCFRKKFSAIGVPGGFIGTKTQL